MRKVLIPMILLLVGCGGSDGPNEVLNPGPTNPISARIGVSNDAPRDNTIWLVCQYTGTIQGAHVNDSFTGDPSDGSHSVPYDGTNSTVETRYDWVLEQGETYTARITYEPNRPLNSGESCFVRFTAMVNGVAGPQATCSLAPGATTCSTELTFTAN